MEEERKSPLPPNILKPLREFSDSFVLFYFDLDGDPCYYENIPTMKDRMALLKLLADYTSSDGNPSDFESQGAEDDDDDGKEKYGE